MNAVLLLASVLTIQDYATMPQIATPRWSPDAKHIAYVVTKADVERNVYDSDLWIIDVDGKTDRQVTFGSGADFRPRWSPDGTRIAFLSDRGGRNAIYILDLRGGEPRLLSNEPTPVRELEWSRDGGEIAFTRIDEVKENRDVRVVGEHTRHVHLYVANVQDGSVRRVTSGELSVFGFSWGPDGAIAFDRGTAPGLDGMYKTDIYIASRNGETRPLVVRPGLDRGPVFSPNGQWIAFTSTGKADWLAEHDVYVIAPTGGAMRMISKDYGRTPEQLAWSEDSSAVFVEGPWNTTTQVFRITADGSSFANATNVEGLAADFDVRGANLAYVFQSVTEPPEVFVNGRRLTHHNDAYRERALGATRVIRWKNPKDGMEIEGLLTLPVDYKSGKRVPLLTFIHGGPASRFDQGFLGYLGHVYAPHVLAAQGYAILRPNPRGSGGYGQAFRQANKNDWGGMDWLDVNAGIDKLIAGGIADPKRLGLMGWSYGGYLAAWSLGQSDRFLAISIGAPIVDLLSMHGTADIRDYVPSYFPGMPLDLLRARSPAWNLKKTRARVLIQHGEADERVPNSQGTLLYRLLDELGTNVTMVNYARTAHGAREPRLRIDVATRNVDLFTTTIPTKDP